MVKRYITIQEYNKQINKYNGLILKGFKPIYKKNWFKIGLGLSIIGVSLITPFTNIFLIPIGLFFCGITLKHIDNYKRIIKNKVLRR